MQAIKDTWLSKPLPPDHLVLFVYGNDGGVVPRLDGQNLFLEAKESWANLPNKIYDLYKYCVKSFEFEYLFKIDDDVYMDNKSIMTFDPHTVLTTTQLNSLIIDPYMSLRFAQFLGQDAQNKGIKNVEVKGRVMVSFNGRPDQLIYDENLDLLKAPKNIFEVKKWVLPLTVK